MNYFPSGLVQPKGSFRFSEDALLLASYAFHKSPTARRVVDAGCGCGVVGLAMLLLDLKCMVLGIDFQPTLVETAKINAKLLHCEDEYLPINFDLASYPSCNTSTSKEVFLNQAITENDINYINSFYNDGKSVDVIVCNPPYRIIGEGRVAQDEMRRKALFANKNELEDFVRFANCILNLSGVAYFVFSTDRYNELVDLLKKYNFAVDQIIYIKGTIDLDAKIFLMRASRKDVAYDIAVHGLMAQSTLINDGRYNEFHMADDGDLHSLKENKTNVVDQSVLILREASSWGKGALTKEAKEFCKFLK